MRTTLTLDDDLARELKRIARHTDRSFKVVVNSILRQGLSSGAKPELSLPPFRVEPVASAFRTGVDTAHLGRVNDELEVQDFRIEAASELRDRDHG